PTIARVEQRLDPNYQSPHAGELEAVGRLWQATQQQRNQQQGSSNWPPSQPPSNYQPSGNQPAANPWQTQPQQPPPSSDNRTRAWPASTSGS
ncbi:MAG: hypothetical protein RID07_17890, partial [Lacipirellulaceae bacterium]